MADKEGGDRCADKGPDVWEVGYREGVMAKRGSSEEDGKTRGVNYRAEEKGAEGCKL